MNLKQNSDNMPLIDFNDGFYKSDKEFFCDNKKIRRQVMLSNLD